MKTTNNCIWKTLTITLLLFTSPRIIHAAETNDENTKTNLHFHATDKPGEFTFDTGKVSGLLRQNGRSRGFSNLTYGPDKIRLDSGSGILGFYRVFTQNKRYGAALWDRSSTAQVLSDGAVKITWPAAQDHPYRVTAIYRWKTPITVDLETTVTAVDNLKGFELFLASYHDKGFRSSWIYHKSKSEPKDSQGVFQEAIPETGIWQMAPRSRKEIALIKDGRWQKLPHPVDWIILPDLAAPLALRRNTTAGLDLVYMSLPQDCYAVATPCKDETHYSLYFSLLGKDLNKGQTATVRTRLLITSNTSDLSSAYSYKQFLKEYHNPQQDKQQHRHPTLP